MEIYAIDAAISLMREALSLLDDPKHESLAASLQLVLDTAAEQRLAAEKAGDSVAPAFAQQFNSKDHP